MVWFTNRPYFMLQGNFADPGSAKHAADRLRRTENVCALLAAKDHVNIFLYDGGIVPDLEEIITGGHDNKTARTVAVYQGQTINASALIAMFKHIIANTAPAAGAS